MHVTIKTVENYIKPPQIANVKKILEYLEFLRHARAHELKVHNNILMTATVF